MAAGQCTKVDAAADAAAVGLLGCGVMAGIGAAINTGEVKRGESVAVIGCGGVGIAAIAGAKLAGATTIIAVDNDSNKIEMAKSLGATHGVNSSEEDPIEAIRAPTGGNGADVVIDAVGCPETYKQAFYARDLAGRVVLVGVPTPDMKLELPLLDGFKDRDLVDVISTFQGQDRHAEKFRLVAYPTAKGCAAAYFPEANALVHKENVARESNTPASKPCSSASYPTTRLSQGTRVLHF